MKLLAIDFLKRLLVLAALSCLFVVVFVVGFLAVTKTVFIDDWRRV